MSNDPVFDELAALVRLDDADWWARRDREVAARRSKEDGAAELARMRQRAALLLEGGFTQESLHGALLATPKETAALRHARKFPFLSATMFCLAGGVGVGKTTAAAWLALKREDSAPGFLRAGELERRGRYDKKLEEWLASRTSLVIDDLGAEVLDSKGVFVSLLDQEIDRSYSKRSILCITTNLVEEQVAERYGARMWSRFQQRGVWASCGMRDLRKEVP